MIFGARRGKKHERSRDGVTLLRAVASRLLCGGDVSVGGIITWPKNVDSTPPHDRDWLGSYIGRVSGPPSRRSIPWPTRERNFSAISLHPFLHPPPSSPRLPSGYQIFQISVTRVNRFSILLGNLWGEKGSAMEGTGNVTDISHVFHKKYL